MTKSPVTLLVGTKNAHKLAEIRRLIAGLGVEVVDLSQFPNVPDAVEDGATFEENGRAKALHFADATGLLTVSDDSGLEVDALGGAPGVYSARFAGENADDEANNRRLMEKLAGVPEGKRTARFRCVIALASPGEVILTTEGAVEGRITDKPRGDYGFGYDPFFAPQGYEETFGQLGSDVKDAISHRARALARFARRFEEYLRG